VKTLYKRDDRIYSRSQGVWSPQLASYNISTPISDGTDFIFAIYFTENNFYINSGEEWKFGELPHRLLQEFSPLDQPFIWKKKILKNADKISIEKDDGQQTYRAYFRNLNDSEFRGVILQEQKDTMLDELEFERVEDKEIVIPPGARKAEELE
jgi:hypothetical protein